MKPRNNVTTNSCIHFCSKMISQDHAVLASSQKIGIFLLKYLFDTLCFSITLKAVTMNKYTFYI